MVKYQRQYENYEEKADDADEVPEVDTIPTEKKCFGDGFKVLVLGVVIFCISITIGLVVDIYYLRNKVTDPCIDCPKNIAVVTSAPECTTIATNLLTQNDNAIDATIGAMICLAVVRPDQCSLASAGYLLVHHNDKDEYLDFQFAAPRGGKQKDNTVAIPGLLAGLRKASVRYGSLPFSKLIQPSINLALNGFTVDNATARYMQSLPDDLRNNFISNGKIVRAGEKLKMPLLADTLSKLSNGRYSLAEDIAKATNRTITVDDFKQYTNKLTWKTPLSIDLGGTKVVSTGAPSSGVLLLSALNVLNELHKIDPLVSPAATVEVLKVVLPATKLLEDPEFDPTQKDIVQKLLNTTIAKYYANKITSIVKNDSNVPVLNTEPLKNGSSVSVAVINLKGDVVSLVTSLGDVFGSKMMTESGIILNNGLAMFSKEGKGYNEMASFKRPLSYASPAFILRDPMITSFAPSADEEGLVAAVQVIRNRLLHHLSEKESINYPRLFLDVHRGGVDIEGERFSKYGLQNVTASLKSQFGSTRDVESIGSVNVAFYTNITSIVRDPRSV